MKNIVRGDQEKDCLNKGRTFIENNFLNDNIQNLDLFKDTRHGEEDTSSGISKSSLALYITSERYICVHVYTGLYSNLDFHKN